VPYSKRYSLLLLLYEFLFVFIIDLYRTTHPLSEPEYQETCNHGNLVEENSNDKESDTSEDCQELFRRSDQEIAEWVASRPHILNLMKRNQ
jgi:hypothetical protein